MHILLLPLLLSTVSVCQEVAAELQLAVEAGYINEQSAEAISNRCIEPINSYENIQTSEAT